MDGASEFELRRWSRGLRTAQVTWLSASLILVIALALWVRGAEFYLLSLAERAEHADFARLSPSRPLGRGYGITGFALMLLNLLYLLRRRFPRMPIGRMHLWLDAHVITGLMAALFVAFHSAFRLRSPVAQVMAVALVLTVVTGIVGRFFHAFVPRVEGELKARMADLTELFGALDKLLARGLAERKPSEPPPGTGVLRVLARVPRWWREARARRAFVESTVRSVSMNADPLERAVAQPLAREVARLAGREVYAVAGRALLSAWRPWHRLCALTMVAGVLLHVGVALFYGYAWDVAS